MPRHVARGLQSTLNLIRGTPYIQLSLIHFLESRALLRSPVHSFVHARSFMSSVVSPCAI